MAPHGSHISFQNLLLIAERSVQVISGSKRLHVEVLPSTHIQCISPRHFGARIVLMATWSNISSSSPSWLHPRPAVLQTRPMLPSSAHTTCSKMEPAQPGCKVIKQRPDTGDSHAGLALLCCSIPGALSCLKWPCRRCWAQLEGAGGSCPAALPTRCWDPKQRLSIRCHTLRGLLRTSTRRFVLVSILAVRLLVIQSN